ncbi:MAG: hypothetical protein OXI41_14055 [Chloroflexota bacterium]|nr:hypothetical protein [Chloroflexota bacterium]
MTTTTRTITFTVDEDTHRRACSAAKQRGLSLPELVAEALTASVAGGETTSADVERAQSSPDRDARARRFRETIERIRASNPGLSAADNLSREELYAERDFFRHRGLD